MKLYHGSNLEIKEVDLGLCRPYKDFGRGFYLTDIRQQAERMAARTARMAKGEAVVSIFEFDLESAYRQGLKIEVFEKHDEEWARFVMTNRDVNKA